MELKKHLNARKVFFTLYFIAFAIYIIVGLQPAQAQHYDVVSRLEIPKLGLVSEVASLKLENRKLETPDTIVGSYSRAQNKTLLIGHSTTVFARLNEMEIGDSLDYANNSYKVVAINTLAKEDILMDEILQHEDVDTVVLMTCAGELLGNGEATHRLIIVAKKTE